MSRRLMLFGCRLLSALLLLLTGGAVSASADVFPITGILSSPQIPFVAILSLPAVQNVVLQTYGFGGGTNAASQIISAGGTDPFLAIFAGTGPSASILTSGTTTFGTSLDVSNFAAFAGCPPASMVNWGGSPVCGDIKMTMTSLSAGTYTIVLSDGNYIANAVFDNGTFSEGFTDFTGGVFCNLANNAVACPSTSGAFALDIITTGSAVVNPVPEPGTLLLLSTGLVSLAGLRKRRQTRHRS